MKKQLLVLVPALALVLAGCVQSSPTGHCKDGAYTPSETPWNDPIYCDEVELDKISEKEDGTKVTVRGTVLASSGSTFALGRGDKVAYVYNLASSSAVGDQPGFSAKDYIGKYVEVTARKSSYSGSVQLSGYDSGTKTYFEDNKITELKAKGEEIAPVEWTSYNDYTSADAGRLVKIKAYASKDYTWNASASGNQDVEIIGADYQTITLRLEKFDAANIVPSLIDLEKDCYYDITALATQASSGLRLVLMNTAFEKNITKLEGTFVRPAPTKLMASYQGDKGELNLVTGETGQIVVTAEPAMADTSATFHVDPEGIVTVSETGLITPVAEGEASITVKSTVVETLEVALPKIKVVSKPLADLPDGNYEVTLDAGNQPLTTEAAAAPVVASLVAKEDTESDSYKKVELEFSAGSYWKANYSEMFIPKTADGGYVKVVNPVGTITKLEINTYNYTNYNLYKTADGTGEAVTGTAGTAGSQNLSKVMVFENFNSEYFYFAPGNYDFNIFEIKMYITVGEIVPESITVSGAESVIAGRTSKYTASVLPAGAPSEVVWSVENGTGTATIAEDGTLSATTAGTITVKATAATVESVVGSKDVTITEPIASVKVSTANFANFGTNITSLPDGDAPAEFLAALQVKTTLEEGKSAGNITAAKNIAKVYECYKNNNPVYDFSARGLKFGTGSINGTITLVMDVAITKVVVKGYGWNSTDKTLTVNGVGKDLDVLYNNKDEGGNYIAAYDPASVEYEFAIGTDTITFSFGNRGFIQSIEFYAAA